MVNQVYIYNTLLGEKEEFNPSQPPNVGIYVCGPTVYSEVHLGNCRTFISFDIVVRYLRYIGYNVRYVRNITDAGHLENDAEVGEDKIAKKARLEQLEPMEIVQRYTLNFHKVMSLFNALSPSIEPTATGHIVEQIEMIKKILENGYAYEVNGSVYFDVNKYIKNGKKYGKLSGRSIDDLISGTRELDGQEEKKASVDFALWKKASPQHIMKWESPWGEGFPGWHLECSAMGTKYLGEQMDIHGGGMDLKFPHHECEIAQGTAVNNISPVKYWMHGNMLTLNGKRMSKSTGNTLLPEELFSGNNQLLNKAYSPMVVRFFMLQAHYRSVLDFSSDALNAAEKGFNKLMEAKRILNQTKHIKSAQNEDLEKAIKSLCLDCYKHMNDDFNTPKTIATLFEIVTLINSKLSAASFGMISEDLFKELKATVNGFIEDVLGIKDQKKENESLSEGLIDILLKMRNEAKKNKNYALSDQIRDQLIALGIVIKDSKEKTTYTIK